MWPLRIQQLPNFFVNFGTTKYRHLISDPSSDSSFVSKQLAFVYTRTSMPSFVFYAPRASAARRTGRAGAWPFWAAQRSSEFGELSSVWFSTNDRQSSPIQIVNNTRNHCHSAPSYRRSAARRSHRCVKRSRCAVLPFLKLNKIFFGYFDPENIFLDNRNKWFSGWATR